MELDHITVVDIILICVAGCSWEVHIRNALFWYSCHTKKFTYPNNSKLTTFDHLDFHWTFALI